MEDIAGAKYSIIKNEFGKGEAGDSVMCIKPFQAVGTFYTPAGDQGRRTPLIEAAGSCTSFLYE